MVNHIIINIQMCNKTDHIFTERIAFYAQMANLLNKFVRIMLFIEFKNEVIIYIADRICFILYIYLAII